MWLTESLGLTQLCQRPVEVVEVDPRGEFLGAVQHPYVRVGVALAREGAQRQQVVLPVDGRDDDPRPTAVHKFSVQHDTSDTPVAIGERVNFCDQEHHVHRPGQRIVECLVGFEAFHKRSGNQFRRDEHGIPGTVFLFLEQAWLLFRTTGKQCGVTCLEQRDEFLGRCRYAVHLLAVRDKLISAEDVVGIGRALGKELAAEDDVSRFLDQKFRAFDVVREVRLEEREIAQPLRSKRRHGAHWQYGAAQRREQCHEQFQAVCIIGCARGPGAGRARGEPCLAGTENSTDE